MNLEARLATAFDAWSQARTRLGELRKRIQPQIGGQAGGQLAQSPEVATHYAEIREQEAICKDLFAELVAVGEQVADERQSREVAAAVAKIMNDQGAK